jgi:hypothetical protein
MAYAQKKQITVPSRTEFKGNPMIEIPVGKDGEAWGFGLNKARAILKYMKDIEKFVADVEQSRV